MGQNKNTAFGAANRLKMLGELENTKLDMLVIGGGITGAGIALDAATRGMKVAVVEMQDFAGGTSSRSTKLVHGGLRYLKQLEFGVVAEVGKERAIVYENGPHVTTPEWMLLPMYKGGSLGKFTTSIALRVYDYLAGVKRNERRIMLDTDATLAKEPLLKKDGLVGGGYYVEYRTDDARLTIEVMKKAVELGAAAVNYAKVEKLAYDGSGKVEGAIIRDQISGSEFTIKATKIVNATGPWVDEIRDMDGSKKGKTLRLTKGVHLVFDGGRFPLRQAVYFDTPDGRMVFVIPREGKTYFGTTDTNYTGDIANPTTTAEDRSYLLKAANGMFPELKLTEKDIESSWAGLRPLIQQEGKSPSEISRRDEIFVSNSGLISIAGGKLTGYRKMAADVVEKTIELMRNDGDSVSSGRCITKELRISGGDVGGSKGFEHFVQQKGIEGQRYGFNVKDAQFLARRYGSNVDRLFSGAPGLSEWAEQFKLPLVLAVQLDYAMDEEMTVKPTDFFIRRTGNLLFRMEDVQRYKANVIAAMAARLHWSEQEVAAHTSELEQQIVIASKPN